MMGVARNLLITARLWSSEGNDFSHVCLFTFCYVDGRSVGIRLKCLLATSYYLFLLSYYIFSSRLSITLITHATEVPVGKHHF